MSEVWRNLPVDLQVKVAEDHLPFSSLCRLRSVSKSWSKPKLRPDYLAGLYIRNTKVIADRISIHISVHKGSRQGRVFKKLYVRRAHCLNCINGLLCCVQEFKWRPKFIVCNILTGCKWKVLPRPPPSPKRELLFAGVEPLGRPLESGIRNPNSATRSVYNTLTGQATSAE